MKHHEEIMDLRAVLFDRGIVHDQHQWRRIGRGFARNGIHLQHFVVPDAWLSGHVDGRWLLHARGWAGALEEHDDAMFEEHRALCDRRNCLLGGRL